MENRISAPGQQETAVPPVPSTSLRAGEMTDFGWGMMREFPGRRAVARDLSGYWEVDGILQQRILEKHLGLVVDLFVIHAQIKHHGALNLEYGKLAGEPVPESRGAHGSTVVVAQDDATRFDHREGLLRFGGKPWHAVAGIAEDELGRSTMRRPVIPGVHADEDLFDSGFGRLTPVEKADFVLAGNGWKIESDDLAAGRKMQGNIQRRAPFRSAKFDYAFRLQVVHYLRQDDQFLWKHAEMAGKRKEQFGRAGAIHSREQLVDFSRGNFEIIPPRQTLPPVGQTKPRVQMIGVGDETEDSGRTIAQQNAKRIQVAG